jgi:drug/metabolite transporter (DMT)-like permease
MPTSTTKSSPTAFILASFTIILWSSGFVFTRVAVRYFNPYALGLLRYGTAAIVLIIIGSFRHVGLPRMRDLPLFFLLGALGFTIYMITFNVAMTTISSATGSILTATVPVITALLSSLFFRERLSLVGWIAVGMEFAGIVLLTLWHGTFSIEKGLVWMMLAAISFAAYNLIQRFATKRYTSMQSTIYSIVAGASLLLVFLPSAIQDLRTAPTTAILTILYLGIFPSAIGFLLWTKALSIAYQMSEVTNFMFITPLLATVLEFSISGELPDPGTIIGGAVILAGLLLFNNRQRLHRI